MKNKELIRDILTNILTKSSLQFEEITALEEDDGATIFYSIKTAYPQVLIGRDGETLSAMNHLLKKILDNQVEENEFMPEVFIDVNDFQKKKIENLRAVAHMMAERARFFKSSVRVDPMSAYERKIIHSFLQTKSDVKTESEGEGRDRHVVIRYTGEQ